MERDLLEAALALGTRAGDLRLKARKVPAVGEVLSAGSGGVAESHAVH